MNGLEQDYLPEDTDFLDYLTPIGQINMERLLDNFQNFIARVRFRILQVPETPKEYVGQDLLYAYLDQFVSLIHGAMFLEAQTGRGRMDMIIFHNGRKSIVETKIWEGKMRYDAGKKQLSVYLKLERVREGYYVVFDHLTVFGGILKLRLSLTSLARDFLIWLNALSVLPPVIS